jgi:hypothetical protein
LLARSALSEFYFFSSVRHPKNNLPNSLQKKPGWIFEMRWMIAPQAMGRNANGIVIQDPLAGPVTYTRNKIQDRAWNDKMYFLPILQDEMNRNSELVQNPLY